MSKSSFTTLFFLLVGALACGLTQTLQAQQSSSQAMSNMHGAPQAMVDGAEHPELIPDLTAYRLVFVVFGLASDATADQTQLQMLRLHNAGLSDTDAGAAAKILNSFISEYRSLINGFNDSAHSTILSGGTPDLKSFETRINALVTITRNQLKQALSPQAMAALDSFVQREKAKMRVRAD